MIFQILICLILGYAFGLIQTGYLYGKIVKGIDIREYGSHSAGATNTVRTLGKGAGYFVFLGDGLKMTAAVCLVRFFLFSGQGRLTGILVMVTAIGVILGHDFPFYLGFKGGKGISSTGGLMLGLHPLIAVFEGILFLIVFFTTRYVSVGSLIVTAAFPFFVLLFFPGRYDMFALALVITVIDWWQHRENIKRLRNGTESRFEKKRKDTDAGN